MKKDNSVRQYFGVNLAVLLSEKISSVYPEFNKKSYVSAIKKEVENASYSQRVDLHAIELRKYLPKDYKKAVEILISILGKENPHETGMFRTYYWILPIAKFVEKFGLEEYTTSIKAIEEITKRNTGEYAIRPYIRAYPKRTLKIMKRWSQSKNFHLRRLASEGLRPKLPWATKLEIFIDNPEPVFEILENLKEDEVMFVKKSVANHLTDYLKVNLEPTRALIEQWKKTDNEDTKWIVKRATRKIG